ncbi:MAG: hypothetical protein HC915_00965 [Anaerolineae bacterium]|nr:hypothetical protein [Anaerolineae bacterium]
MRSFNAALDDKLYDLAHDEAGAQRVAEMGFNWVHLVCSAGYPPEIEEVDWVAFARAVRVYHQAGLQVSGIIQATNCVFAGSYKTKDWYAQDPQGNPIIFMPGRYVTSIIHPEWQAEVQARIQTVLEAEADGVTLAYPWYGGAGLLWRGTLLGQVGCYHPLSQEQYAEAADGAAIPPLLDLRDLDSLAYLHWRAAQLRATLATWAATAHAQAPACHVSILQSAPAAQHLGLALGLDLTQPIRGIAGVIFETRTLPDLRQNGTLASNAPLLGQVKAHPQTTPATLLGHEQGTGFDRVHPARAFARQVSEASALHVPLAVQGADYLYHRQFTSLLHARYKAQQHTLGRLNAWGKRTLNGWRVVSPPVHSQFTCRQTSPGTAGKKH